MRITVTNTALLNAGDAAIMDGTAAILRRTFGSDINISVHDQQPDEAQRAYPNYRIYSTLYGALENARVDAFRLGTFRTLLAAALWRTPSRWLARQLVPGPVAETLETYARSDMIVSAGGTYLVPHYRTRPKLFELLAARLLRRPYAFFTQSLGPFPKDRRLFKYVLGGASAVLVRDNRSLDYLLEIGLRPNRVHRCADAAFAGFEPDSDTRPDRNALHIGISVRDWPHGDENANDMMERYTEAVSHLTEYLVRQHDARISFVSTCQGSTAYWTDDATVADSIVDRLPKSIAEKVTVDRAFRTPDALTSHIGTFDLYISTRMHGAILALCAGVPVLPIAYEFKTTELFKELGMDDFVQDIASVTGPMLCSACDEILRKRPDLVGRIRELLPQIRDSAYSAGPFMAESVEYRR